MAGGTSQDMDPANIVDVVAIDGPSGAGKSTVARELAGRLGFSYLDTGAMYRAVTWHLLSRGLTDLRDEATVLEQMVGLSLELGRVGDVRLGGEDISAHLRSHEVESQVSTVSALAGVRARMRQLQRQVAVAGPVVAEGRDMSSVVFPAARWKIYLDANPDERARRRRGDFEGQGRAVSQQQVLEEIQVRDHLDSSRRDGPLTRTSDAFYIDTTGKSLAEVVALLAAHVGDQEADTEAS